MNERKWHSRIILDRASSEDEETWSAQHGKEAGKYMNVTGAKLFDVVTIDLHDVRWSRMKIGKIFCRKYNLLFSFLILSSSLDFAHFFSCQLTTKTYSRSLWSSVVCSLIAGLRSPFRPESVHAIHTYSASHFSSFVLAHDTRKVSIVSSDRSTNVRLSIQSHFFSTYTICLGHVFSTT